MIISSIKDGFGNQLFMFACGYAAARKQGGGLVLDATNLATSNLRNYELGGLNLRYDHLLNIPKKWPWVVKIIIRKFLRIVLTIIAKLFTEKTTCEFDPSVLNLKGSYRLLGYWQSEKYFKEYRSELLPMFTPKYFTTKSFNDVLEKVQRTESVSVHVRRGDFIALGWCLGKHYYMNAIKTILGKVSQPTFYVFSDDIEYAKEMFEGFDVKMEFVSYESINSTIEDFLLMKSCKHNIIANSSYSWWGAWANDNPDKIVVCPPRESRDFFYPADWIVAKLNLS